MIPRVISFGRYKNIKTNEEFTKKTIFDKIKNYRTIKTIELPIIRIQCTYCGKILDIQSREFLRFDKNQRLYDCIRDNKDYSYICIDCQKDKKLCKDCFNNSNCPAYNDKENTFRNIGCMTLHNYNLAQNNKIYCKDCKEFSTCHCKDENKHCVNNLGCVTRLNYERNINKWYYEHNSSEKMRKASRNLGFRTGHDNILKCMNSDSYKQNLKDRQAAGLCKECG